MPKTKRKMKPLPATFQGAAVVRGEGMKVDDFDAFVEREAFDQFDATREQWIVLPQRALEDSGGFTEPRVFGSRDLAVRYAKAMACGNVDHRVMRLSDHTLVIATENEL